MIRVHSYESLGTYDGPGIRLVVFLQGCNFRCLYCANPDTIDAKGESKETAPEEILKMAVSQKPFFGKKGGITFSGGEPTFQAKALVPLFKMLKEAGIHICVDTNGGIWNDDVKEMLSLADLVLLDVKEFNPSRHKTLTERSNEQTLKRRHGLKKTENRSGLDMCWFRDTAPSMKTWKHLASISRITNILKELKSSHTILSEYINTKP